MKRYVVVFVALLVLTAGTFGLSFLSMGVWGTALAVGIALVKSVLVALFFMHLVEHPVSGRATIGIALVLAIFLVGFALLDVRSRADGAGRSTSGTAGPGVELALPGPDRKPLSTGTRSHG